MHVEVSDGKICEEESDKVDRAGQRTPRMAYGHMGITKRGEGGFLMWLTCIKRDAKKAEVEDEDYSPI